MRKLISLNMLMLVCFILGISSESQAKNSEPKLVLGGTPHQALFDVDMQGEVGFAVGTAGKVLRTIDGGKTWKLETNESALSLLGISFNGTSAVAVGQYGAVVVRQSDGVWRQIESGTKERLFSVDINNSGFAVAVGAFGTILRSLDRGESWERVSPPWNGIFFDPDMRLGSLFEPNVYGVVVNESGSAWVVGELALVMNSDDEGLTWKIKNAGGSSEEEVSSTLSGIDMRADGVAYAVGQEGFIMKSKDNGESWHRLKSTTHQNLLDVKTHDNGMVIAPGMRDIIVSYDDAKTWHSVQGLDIQTGWYGSAVIPTKTSGAIIVGNRANILRVQ